MAPIIRPARPDDSDFIAWAILAAQRGHLSRGWFDIALARPEAECLAFIRQVTATPTRSWWHASRFFIAELDGVPAATLCALPAEGAFAAARRAVGEVAAALHLDAAELAGISRRGAYIGTCWIEDAADAWMIEHVATRSSYRRSGLAYALLEHAVEAGKADGRRTAQITFYIGNTAAEQCYAKAGFRFAEEKRHPDFEAATGAPGIRRDTRQI